MRSRCLVPLAMAVLVIPAAPAYEATDPPWYEEPGVGQAFCGPPAYGHVDDLVETVCDLRRLQAGHDNTSAWFEVKLATLVFPPASDDIVYVRLTIGPWSPIVAVTRDGFDVAVPSWLDENRPPSWQWMLEDREAGVISATMVRSELPSGPLVMGAEVEVRAHLVLDRWAEAHDVDRLEGGTWRVDAAVATDPSPAVHEVKQTPLSPHFTVVALLMAVDLRRRAKGQR